MRATLLFITACTLASIGGVVSGASIETSPIQRAGIGNAGHSIQPYFARSQDQGTGELLHQVALPDHYAMTTPEGRVEVADLSNRGLYAQRRFGWQHSEPLVEPAHYAPVPVMDEAIEPLPQDNGFAPSESSDRSGELATDPELSDSLPAQS